jgi:hypothetical protein
MVTPSTSPATTASAKTPKSIGWLKTHKQFTCRCATRVDYFSGGKVKAEIIKLDQPAKRLESNIKAFNKSK